MESTKRLSGQSSLIFFFFWILQQTKSYLKYETSANILIGGWIMQ